MFADRDQPQHPFIGAVWVLLAPLIWLMAALSKFESPERYNFHLAVWSIVALAALVFGVGAAMRKRWANVPLTLLSVGAAVFWFWVSSDSGVNLAIALAFTVMSWYLLYSRFSSQTSQDA